MEYCPVCGSNNVIRFKCPGKDVVCGDCGYIIEKANPMWKKEIFK